MKTIPASRLFGVLAIAFLFGLANAVLGTSPEYDSEGVGTILTALESVGLDIFYPGVINNHCEWGNMLVRSNVYALGFAIILFGLLTIPWRRFRFGWLGLILFSLPTPWLFYCLVLRREVTFMQALDWPTSILLPFLAGAFSLACLTAAGLQIAERFGESHVRCCAWLRGTAWAVWTGGNLMLALYTGMWVMSSDVSLMAAVNGSDVAEVRQVLARNPNVIKNQKNEIYNLAMLRTAIKAHDVEMARLLLEHGCPVRSMRQSTSDYYDPMSVAAASGSMEMFRLLIEKGGDIHAVTDNGYTTLHKASGSPEIAAFLIINGLNVRTKTKYGETPLHRAAGNRTLTVGSLKVAELLLAHGADIKAKDDLMGNVPLHEAVTPRMVSLLLRHGADINAQNKNGETPLLHIVDRRKYAAAKALVQAGADVNIPASSYNPDTPLAALRTNPSNGRQKTELEALLLARGAKLHYAKLHGLTYNIHHGEGMDGKLDLARIAELIKAEKPDLVALQEVENGTTRTTKVDQTAELAKNTGMYGYFGKAFDFAGGEFGNAVLMPADRAGNIVTKPLPPSGEPRNVIQSFYSRNYPGLDTPITFLATHLDWGNADGRKKQVEAIVEYAAKLPADAPVILAGDFNAEPDDAALAPLRAAGWVDVTADAGLSFPADVPTKKIDYIWVRPGKFKLKVLESRVVEEKVASDHRPVLSVIELSL